MLSVSTNSIRNNYSQLQFKRRESSEEKYQPKSNVSTKLKKGTLITTAAFLAGLGTGKVMMPESRVNANPKEITAPIPKAAESDNSNTITWEEATNNAKATPQQSNNIPPSNKQRTWTKTTTFSANGEEHIAVNKYTVMEVPFLVEQTVKNAKTNKLEQKNTFADYQIVPTKVEIRNQNNKLVEKRQINGINMEYAVPESAKFTSYNDDGSITTTDILYKMEITSKDNRPKPQPKPQPKKESNSEAQKALEEFMGGFFSE